MSRSISLCINFESNINVNPVEVIQILLENGWEAVRENRVNYLPVNDNDMFGWTNEEMKLDKMFDIIINKYKNNEIIGVSLFWNDSDIGFNLLISPSELTFLLDINTKYIDNGNDIVDFNWYSTKILPCLKEKFYINNYNFSLLR